MYLDGGRSYEEFWNIGDEMIDKAKAGYNHLSENYKTALDESDN